MSRSTRIVVNTFAAYARLAVAAVSGLVTLPIALRTLGASDYGIFSVIAGSLSLLLFINGALTGGVQRHIAYALGEGSSSDAAQWFSASLMMHAVLAMVVFAAAMLPSHWIVHHLLRLPQERVQAAMWTYRAVALVLFCSILGTPYQAFLMAREAMASLSVMAMASSVFLVIGVYLLRILPGDHLIWYSAIYTVTDGFILIGPALYCFFSFPECRHIASITGNGERIRQLLRFSSWNLLGMLAVQIRYQGPGILFNRFFGTTENAANGIAMQVNGFASGISTGLLTATSPSIVKAEAAGDRTEMLFISNLSNKYAFLLLWAMLGPVLFEMKYCLALWLHQMPADTTTFSTILLLVLLIDMLTAGFTATIQAEGRIALYQAVIGGLLCISVPAGYLLLRSGMVASSVLWAMAAGSALAGAGRLWFLCHRIGLRGTDWLRGAFLPSTLTCAAGSLTMAVVVLFLAPSWQRLVLLYLLNSAIAVALTWAFATSSVERRLLQGYRSRVQEQFNGGWRAFALAKRH